VSVLHWAGSLTNLGITVDIELAMRTILAAKPDAAGFVDFNGFLQLMRLEHIRDSRVVRSPVSQPPAPATSPPSAIQWAQPFASSFPNPSHATATPPPPQPPVTAGPPTPLPFPSLATAPAHTPPPVQPPVPPLGPTAPMSFNPYAAYTTPRQPMPQPPGQGGASGGPPLDAWVAAPPNTAPTYLAQTQVPTYSAPAPVPRPAPQYTMPPTVQPPDLPTRWDEVPALGCEYAVVSSWPMGLRFIPGGMEAAAEALKTLTMDTMVWTLVTDAPSPFVVRRGKQTPQQQPQPQQQPPPPPQPQPQPPQQMPFQLAPSIRHAFPCQRCTGGLQFALALPQRYERQLFACDRCRLTRHASSGVWHCTTCNDFDLCVDCIAHPTTTP